jgi:hypothetical protein
MLNFVFLDDVTQNRAENVILAELLSFFGSIVAHSLVGQWSSRTEMGRHGGHFEEAEVKSRELTNLNAENCEVSRDFVERANQSAA